MDWAADIHLTPNGRFRYASERTTSTLSIFRVDAATGLITQIDTVLTAGAPEALVTNSNIKPITSALLRMVNTPDQR
jgi:6-phosphogluconolactonase